MFMYEPDPIFQQLGTYVIPGKEGIEKIFRYACWGKGGKKFISTNERTPESWEEFMAWSDKNHEPPLILEVGCGSGYLGSLLAARGARVIGVDPALNPAAKGHLDKIHTHENLTLLARGLEAITKPTSDQDHYDELTPELIEMLGRAERSALSLLGEIGAQPDMALCAWMPYGLNLTPAIRDLGAKSIYYITSSLGGAGLDFGDCGELGSYRHQFEREGAEAVVSFEPGPNYVPFSHRQFDARVPIEAPALGLAQFREGIPCPDFEVRYEDFERRGELETYSFPKRYERYIDCISKDDVPELPFHFVQDTMRHKMYQVFDHSEAEGKVSLLIRDLDPAEAKRVMRIMETNRIPKNQTRPKLKR